jgi:hypothetical protein
MRLQSSFMSRRLLQRVTTFKFLAACEWLMVHYSKYIIIILTLINTHRHRHSLYLLWFPSTIAIITTSDDFCSSLFSTYESTWSLETASKRHHPPYGPPRLSLGEDKYLAGRLHSEDYSERSRGDIGTSRLDVRSASHFRRMRARNENPPNT